METIKSVGAALLAAAGVCIGLSMWFGHFWAIYGDWLELARPHILRALGAD